MNIVMLGPQGVGKGTQAQALHARTGLVHVASGDVLRAAIRAGTPLGRAAQPYYDAGELVPDEITIGLLLEEIRTVPPDRDVLLDGFPRTVAQARALDEALERAGERIGLVVDLRAPLDTVKARLEGRLVCRAGGHVYNARTRPPRVSGVCDIDGSELYQRADDYPEAIERRLQIWRRENDDLVGYYEGRGLLRAVDANHPAEALTDELERLLREGSSVA